MWNPLSTFCYLSAQRDALGQFVHGQLAVEVALLGGGAQLDHDGDGGHDGDEEAAHAVDDHLQVGVVGLRVVGDGCVAEGEGVSGSGVGSEFMMHMSIPSRPEQSIVECSE